jgi:hypothetical protein
MNDKIVKKSSERPQNKHLTPGGPGRPKGQRNYKTIQREALMKIGESRNMTLEEVEQTIQEVGLLKAMKGDYNFYRDYMDREHGKVPEKNINVNVSVEPTDRIKDLAAKLNS